MEAHQQSWTTSVLSGPDQFSFWREVVWEAFVPVTLSRAALRGGFAGTVGASRLGPLGIAAIASEAQTVERTAADVRRRAGDVYFLNLPLRGGSTVAQDGRVAELGPGDFAVVDGSRPFSLAFAEDFEQLSLILPHELLGPLLGSAAVSTAVAVRGDLGLGAVAAGALRPFFAGGGPVSGVDAAMARPLAERLAALVALALGAGASAAAGSRAALTQAALDEVERSLGDPDLTPATVAARIGVSTRYLHQLFSARGPSFGRWLLARRLERCRADLVDPELAHWTIGEIGWSHGIPDPSYLARAFRRAYGVSPGEHRRAAAAVSQRAAL